MLKEKMVDQSDVQIDFLGGNGPVVAHGTVQGYRFAFHARRHRWAFTVALHPDGDPTGIAMADERSFYLEGTYGEPGSYTASSMPDEDARAIIYSSAKVFLAQQAQELGIVPHQGV